MKKMKKLEELNKRYKKLAKKKAGFKVWKKLSKEKKNKLKIKVAIINQFDFLSDKTKEPYNKDDTKLAKAELRRVAKKKCGLGWSYMDKEKRSVATYKTVISTGRRVEENEV